jgi:hypothetical protein
VDGSERQRGSSGGSWRDARPSQLVYGGSKILRSLESYRIFRQSEPPRQQFGAGPTPRSSLAAGFGPGRLQRIPAYLDEAFP